MAKKDKYFWIKGCEPPALEAHSEAKHAVFRAYLNAYLSRLTLRPEQERFRLTIVDGFCGGGLYRKDDSSYAPGSPLIFLNEVAAANIELSAQRRKGFVLDVDFYFVDDRLSHIDYLRGEISRSPHAHLLSGKIKFIQKPFHEAALQIKTDINMRRGKRRALFFLDQYGYSDAPLSLIAEILRDIDGSEVLVTFAVDALINYLSDTDRFASAVQPLQISRSQIVEFKKLWDRSENEARYVVQNALYDHVARACGALHSSPFFVKSKTSKRAFWLIHLSKHHTARDVMGEVHWRVSNSSLHYGRAGLLSLGFDGAFSDPSLPFAFDLDARTRSFLRIEEETPKLIFDAAKNAAGDLTFESFFRKLCSHTPVTRTMLADTILRLQNNGDLCIKTAEGAVKSAHKVEWTDRLSPPRTPGLFSMWNPALKRR